MNYQLLARRSVSYSAAELDQANGVKTSFATSASVVNMIASDWNGAAVANAGTTWAKRCARTITITRSSSVGSYTTTAITITGKRGGVTVTETLTPANANGGDVLRGTQLFDAPPTISLPAQANTSGAFQIGVADVGAPSGDHFLGVKLNAGSPGTINVVCQDGFQDALPCGSYVRENGRIERVVGNQTLSPASGACSVYLM